MLNMQRHKVFISYYHEDDQSYKNALLQANDRYTLFDDWSVQEGEIEDDNLSAERIRQIIRDDYMRDATVLILLCGQNSRRRKHIDWEIHTAMFDTSKNPKMGVLVINLPSVPSRVRAGETEDKELVAKHSTTWCSLSTRQEYEDAYPCMPSRIIDNFEKDVPISVVEWSTIQNDPNRLMQLIDNAFKRRKTNDYNHAAALRRQNS